MKRYKRFEEKKKYNSGFNGYIIENVPRRIAKIVASILDENEIMYDMLKDISYYYQFITDIDEHNRENFQDILDIIKKKTGFIEYDLKLNR